MRHSSVLIYVLSCAIISISVQLYKYLQLQKLKQVYKKKVVFRWLSFHNPAEIYGTSSNDRRLFMQKSNKLTFSFWVFAAIAFVLFVIGWKLNV